MNEASSANLRDRNLKRPRFFRASPHHPALSVQGLAEPNSVNNLANTGCSRKKKKERKKKERKVLDDCRRKPNNVVRTLAMSSEASRCCFSGNVHMQIKSLWFHGAQQQKWQK